jgi:hypothetical protein
VLGGGSGGRHYADGEDTIHVVPDSRNLPTEFSESRFPFVVERLGLAVDSGGAGRYRGGCGYEKHIRMLRDAHFMSIADRSILSCWGVRGGRAGRSFEVTIDPGGPAERTVDALADGEPVAAGEVIRIRTTGGGGWGDPFERPYDEVARDVAWGKVSVAGAAADYGVLPSRETSPAARNPRRVAHRLTSRREGVAAPGGVPASDAGPGADGVRTSQAAPESDAELESGGVLQSGDVLGSGDAPGSGDVVEPGAVAALGDVPEPVEFIVDVAASDELRSRLRAARAERIARLGDPFFDRGPGYARLSGGRTFAAVDLR